MTRVRFKPLIIAVRQVRAVRSHIFLLLSTTLRAFLILFRDIDLRYKLTGTCMAPVDEVFEFGRFLDEVRGFYFVDNACLFRLNVLLRLMVQILQLHIVRSKHQLKKAKPLVFLIFLGARVVQFVLLSIGLFLHNASIRAVVYLVAE